MAEFHIKGHVKREGPLRYVAVLCVYRANSPTESKPVEVIQEAAKTYALALERLRALAISAGARIRHEGGDVLVVDLEAVPS